MIYSSYDISLLRSTEIKINQGRRSIMNGGEAILDRYGVPGHLRRWAHDDYGARSERHQAAAVLAKEWYDGITDRYSIPWVTISGPTGTGKSALAALYMAHAASKGIPARWISHSQYVEMCRLRMDLDKIDFGERADFLGELQLLREMFDIVVIDDLGATNLSVHFDGEMATLIRARADLGLCTIITTNMDAEQIEHRWQDRVRSVMNQGQWIDLDLEDLRAGR